MPIDDLTDPFGTPDRAVNPTPNTDTFSTLKPQWDAFLSDPGNRAAMVSFGLQLMQPIPFGGSPASQVGQAVGRAGEGARLAEALDIKQRQEDTRETAAESRAADRERRAGIAEAGLGVRQQQLQLSQMRFGLQQDVANRRLQLQQELLDIRRQRGEARSEYESQRLDQQERNLQRQIQALDLQTQNVQSQIETRTDRTVLQRELNDIRRQRATTTDENAKARLDQREREINAQLTERQEGRAFSEAGRATARLERLATEEAANIEEQLKPDPLLPASRQKVPPQYAPYQGMTRSQIRAKLLNDPEWRRLQTGRGGTEPGQPALPAPAPAGPQAAPRTTIPAGAIEDLIDDPSLAPQFDKKYGPGASKRYLGGT